MHSNEETDKWNSIYFAVLYLLINTEFFIIKPIVVMIRVRQLQRLNVGIMVYII